MTDSLCTITEDIDSPILSPDGKRWVWPHLGKSLPVVAGASTYDAPVFHPLGPPVITGTDITIDLMLQQPTRITSYLMDITLARFLLDRLFTSGGGVTGGAVIYDVTVANQLYLARDVQQVEPGAEFPVVTGVRRAPRVAEVQKYGGKFDFTDEARDRNDQAAFRNQLTQLGNTIIRKLNVVAIAALEAAIAANGGNSTFAGHDWSAAIPNGSNPTAPGLTPGADLANAITLADRDELGVVYDTLLVSPEDLTSLRLFYGAGLDAMLSDYGFSEAFSSPRLVQGKAYVVASGQLGELRVEQPLTTETWRDQDIQATWTQSSVRPVMFVQNPFAVRSITGI